MLFGVKSATVISALLPHFYPDRARLVCFGMTTLAIPSPFLVDRLCQASITQKADELPE